MNKLINKNTIQYIKQGKVLYGQKGLDVDINKFSDSYTSESSLRREIFDYIRNLAPNAPTEYYEQMFKNCRQLLCKRRIQLFQKDFFNRTK